MKSKKELYIIHIEKNEGNIVKEIVIIRLYDPVTKIAIIKKLLELTYPYDVGDVKEY